MYFMCEYGHVILRYDLHSERTLSWFEAPEHDILHEFEDTALIPAGDCGLKYAALATYSLHLWSMEMMGWTPLRVFELGALLPAPVWRNSISLIGTGPALNSPISSLWAQMLVFLLLASSHAGSRRCMKILDLIIMSCSRTGASSLQIMFLRTVSGKDDPVILNELLDRNM
ncbi:hypothetical protein EJB05_34154, partial [Eragrostis curvula]